MKVKKESKRIFKFLMIGIFFLMLFLSVNSITAKADELYFDEDGNLYFHTRDKKATSSTRYKTIGWVIKRYDMPMDAPGQEYVIVTKRTYMPDVEDPEDDRYVLCYFKSDRDEILEAVESVSYRWKAILTQFGDEVYIDSVMTIVENGQEQGALYVGGSYEGEVYFTYEGIVSARGWASPESLEAYFDMKITFPQIVHKPDRQIVKMEQLIYNGHSSLFSFTMGAGEYEAEDYDILKGIPSGEELYIKGQADDRICNIEFVRVSGWIIDYVEIPVTYELKWTDYYGHEQEQTRVIYRYYPVKRDFSYYEYKGKNEYILKSARFTGGVLGDTGLEEIALPELQELKLEIVSYGDVEEHITGYDIEKTDSVESVVLLGENGRKPEIPYADYSQIAETLVSELTVKSDSVMVGDMVILSDEECITDGMKPNTFWGEELELYHDNIIIAKELSNGTVDDCKVELIYENSKGQTLDYECELSQVCVHTPVYCEASAYSDKSMNQALSPELHDVVLGETMLITFNDFGMHKDIKGYGLGSYAKYVGARQISCPFAVIYKGVRYEADSWITVDDYNVQLQVCDDNAEGNYTVYARNIAYNGIDDMKNKAVEESANLNIESYGAWNTFDVRLIGKLHALQISHGDLDYNAAVMPATLTADKDDSYTLSFEMVGDFMDSDYVEIKYTYYHEDKNGLLTPADIYGVSDRNYMDGVIAGKLVENQRLGSEACGKVGNKSTWTVEQRLYGELLVVPKGTTDAELNGAIRENGESELFMKEGSVLVCVDIVSYKDGVPYLSYINEENGKRGYCNMWLEEGGTESYPYGAVVKIPLSDYTYYDYEVSGTH